MRRAPAESTEACAEPNEVKSRRALRCDFAERTEACAEPKEVVAEPLPANSRANAGTIDAEEQALLAKYYADLAQLRQKKRKASPGASLDPTPCAGSIVLRDSVDGSVALQPINYEGHCKGNVKEDPLGEQNAAAEKEPIPTSLPWGRMLLQRLNPVQPYFQAVVMDFDWIPLQQQQSMH